MPRFTPPASFDNQTCYLLVQQLATAPGAVLRATVTSLAAHRDEMNRAVNILIDAV